MKDTEVQKVLHKLKAKELFSIKDLAHGLYLRDIVNSMGTNRLPYDETVYICIVKDVIADYNNGLDDDKEGVFCVHHEQKDMRMKLPNLSNSDKRFASACDMQKLTQWVVNASSHELAKRIMEADK